MIDEASNYGNIDQVSIVLHYINSTYVKENGSSGAEAPYHSLLIPMMTLVI